MTKRDDEDLEVLDILDCTPDVVMNDGCPLQWTHFRIPLIFYYCRIYQCLMSSKLVNCVCVSLRPQKKTRKAKHRCKKSWKKIVKKMPATTANSMMLLFSQSLLSSSPSSSGSPATLPSPSPSSPASPSAVAPDSAALAKDCLPCRIVGTLSFTGLGAYTIYSTRQLPKSLHKYTMMSAGAGK